MCGFLVPNIDSYDTQSASRRSCDRIKITCASTCLLCTGVPFDIWPRPRLKGITLSWISTTPCNNNKMICLCACCQWWRGCHPFSPASASRSPVNNQTFARRNVEFVKSLLISILRVCVCECRCLCQWPPSVAAERKAMLIDINVM